jgi:CHAD domain-containing protein
VRDQLLAHIDAASTRLRAGRVIADEDVHEARKSIKRARAVLRLLQPALDADEVARSRIALRDAGRALSSARDAKVMADRFAEMLERVGLAAFAVDTIPGPVAAGSGAGKLPRVRRPGNPTAARAGLLQARLWLTEAVLLSEDWAPIDAGIRAIYRNGRRDLPAAASAASSEALHEWRKRVKNYLHALEVLAEPERPAQIRRTIGAARRLADALGEEHDLALLADALRASTVSEDARVATLLEAIRLRRRRLRRRALKVGSELYADTPAAMAKKLRRRK